MKKAKLSFRLNETDFEWKPFSNIRFRTGYVGWLWFCINWDIYK